MVTLVAVFSSLGFAENDIKPSIHVEDVCVCDPAGIGSFHCCTHRYKYNDEGYVIADNVLGCKYTFVNGDCPY